MDELAPNRRSYMHLWVLGALSASALAASAVCHQRIGALQEVLGPRPEFVAGAEYADFLRESLNHTIAVGQYDARAGEIEELEDLRNGLLFSAPLLFLVPLFLLYIFRRVVAPAARTAVEAAQKVGSKAVEAADRLVPAPNPISHNQLSTADELRKWVDLRDQGAISEEEFLKMRTAILGSR